ncbi:MAG TPA: type IV toxin-antitoxin system AbiEi family antitoxin domain-containing protein [Solirubrobacteraceae bacterium]|nr:type IV toxin-antitoxin system AbiEi family antitoxin domain-containing protein [Solirubrobacteraceae bacterium]
MAAQQHVVFALGQLVELGLGPAGVRKRAATGRLHRIHRGVYSLVPPDQLTWRGRYLAAVLACGDGAVVSHREAAALHNLRPSNRRQIDVTVPGRSARRLRGLTVHRSVTLTAADVTVADDIPCTTLARTHLDLAAVVPLEQTERALNQAEAMGVLNLRALVDQLERNPHARGAPQLRHALELYMPETAPTESAIEEAFVALCRGAALPGPERQVWFTLDGGEPFRVDFLWRAQRLVLEADSRTFHGTARAFEDDRRRDQRLARAQWQVLRVTRRQLEHDPAWVVEMVADVLRQRAA